MYDKNANIINISHLDTALSVNLSLHKSGSRLNLRIFSSIKSTIHIFSDILMLLHFDVYIVEVYSFGLTVVKFNSFRSTITAFSNYPSLLFFYHYVLFVYWLQSPPIIGTRKFVFVYWLHQFVCHFEIDCNSQNQLAFYFSACFCSSIFFDVWVPLVFRFFYITRIVRSSIFL